MFWVIQHFPDCRHHVFLSHSAEDREALVYPVHAALRARGVFPWLDRHDYPYGRGSRAALRDSILVCRHAAFFVTAATVTQPRGWCVQELAWAELLQDNLLTPGGPALSNVILPLFFVPQSEERLPRSVWQATCDKALFCPADADRVAWATNQITAFLEREQQLAAEYARYARRTAPFRNQIKTRSGLLQRITRFDPHPLPAAPG